MVCANKIYGEPFTYNPVQAKKFAICPRIFRSSMRELNDIIIICLQALSRKGKIIIVSAGKAPLRSTEWKVKRMRRNYEVIP